jgi:endonuclease/exonuclease/phosphatase family metal-dependent hydrolase
LLGDINEWFTWGRPLRWLHTHFGRPPAPRSFPSLLPTFRLDRVWVSRPSVVRSVRAHISPLARQASDHLPVKALVELRWSDGETEVDDEVRARATAIA